MFNIVCGRTPVPSYDNYGVLMMFTLGTKEEVVSAALHFINVIPDDLDYYTNEINKWDGKSRLELAHEDDDCFIFYASPAIKGLHNDFDKFVKTYTVDDEDR